MSGQTRRVHHVVDEFVSQLEETHTYDQLGTMIHSLPSKYQSRLANLFTQIQTLVVDEISGIVKTLTDSECCTFAYHVNPFGLISQETNNKIISYLSLDERMESISSVNKEFNTSVYESMGRLYSDSWRLCLDFESKHDEFPFSLLNNDRITCPWNMNIVSEIPSYVNFSQLKDRKNMHFVVDSLFV